jgi:hypothetical protein
MRTLLAATLLLGAAGLAHTQPPPPKQPEGPPVYRYGVPYRPRIYPQTTPKQALESVIVAADRGEFAYLVAHLMEPEFIDARLAARTQQFEAPIEAELIRLRDFQKANPDRVAPEFRIPDDPVRFRAMVAERARERAFAQLARDVQAQLLEDPQSLKDLRRFLREGAFAGDPVARVSLPDVKDRAVFLRKIGDRWYVENRQTDEGKGPEPKGAPPDKKP